MIDSFHYSTVSAILQVVFYNLSIFYTKNILPNTRNLVNSLDNFPIFRYNKNIIGVPKKTERSIQLIL